MLTPSIVTEVAEVKPVPSITKVAPEGSSPIPGVTPETETAPPTVMVPGFTVAVKSEPGESGDPAVAVTVPVAPGAAVGSTCAVTRTIGMPGNWPRLDVVE